MDGETVMGYVDNLTSFGIIAPQKRSLIVTNKRLLILGTETTASFLTSTGFAYAFGIFGRGMANRLTKDELDKTAKQFANSNLDELLKSSPGNFSLNLQSVIGVEINRLKIKIITNEKSFGYSLGNPDTRNKKLQIYDTYVQVLRQALGDKIAAK